MVSTEGEQMRRPIASPLLAIAVVACLTSCVGPRVDIPRDSFDLPKCELTSEPITVQSLKQKSPVECDLQGAQILFPDGYTMRAPEIGSSDSAAGNGHDDTHTLFNFGSFGLVAAERSVGSTKTRWWGTSEGLKEYWAAFGKTGPSLQK
jgi:hypothetical protein